MSVAVLTGSIALMAESQSLAFETGCIPASRRIRFFSRIRSRANISWSRLQARAVAIPSDCGRGEVNFKRKWGRFWVWLDWSVDVEGSEAGDEVSGLGRERSRRRESGVGSSWVFGGEVIVAI